MGIIRVSCGLFGGSLMQALEQAKAGDTLLLAPGKYYHEGLRLENVTLRAEIPGEAKVIFNSVLVLGEVHLEGIVLRGTKYSLVPRLFMQKCYPMPRELKRHIIANRAARLQVENCTIHAGIGLLEGSCGAFANTEMRGFSLAALAIDEASKATIDRCKIHDSTNGICIDRGGFAEVRNTEIWGMRKPAIHIEDPTSVATFVDCVIRDNFSNGVLVYNEGMVTLEGTVIRQSAGERTLIHVEKGAHAAINRCKIHDTPGPGICVIDGGVGEVRDTEVWACGRSSITIRGAKSVGTITDCRIRDNPGNAIRVRDEARATIRCSEIDHSLNDYPLIFVANGAHAAIDRCKVHDTAWGICVQIGASSEVRETEMWACRGSAVVATGRSTTVRMFNCRFDAQVRVPVCLEDGAYLRAEGCNLPEKSLLVKNAVLDLVRDVTSDDCTGEGQQSDSITLTGTGESREEDFEASAIIADLAAVVDVENKTRGLIYRTKQWRN
jgi:Right handed beta helix region